MNVTDYLARWGVRTHPFAAEEASKDPLLAPPEPTANATFRHPDFVKIAGDPSRPGPAIVFGGHGSGKTALRLQLEAFLKSESREGERVRTLIVPFDEFNPLLDKFSRHVRGKTPLETLQHFTLADHLDGLLSTTITTFLDEVLSPADPKALNTLTQPQRDELLLLQAIYDAPHVVEQRAAQLRTQLRRFPRSLISTHWLRRLTAMFWILTIASAAGIAWFGSRTLTMPLWVLFGALPVATLLTSIPYLNASFRIGRTSHLLSRNLRVLDRSTDSLRGLLERLPMRLSLDRSLPRDDSPASRFSLLVRLQRLLQSLGYDSITVLIDRVDEPTLVNGDPERLRAFLAPIFNNRLMQHTGLALKLFLPIELKHDLDRASSEYLTEARLDKQHLIAPLAWSGAALYDLCESRLHAAGSGLPLASLLAPELSRREIELILESQASPRAALKLMYRAVQIQSAATEAASHRQTPCPITRATLDAARQPAF